MVQVRRFVIAAILGFSARNLSLNNSEMNVAVLLPLIGALIVQMHKNNPV
jgi:hypothetical protein